jgi:hypothetical protein
LSGQAFHASSSVAGDPRTASDIGTGGPDNGFPGLRLDEPSAGISVAPVVNQLSAWALAALPARMGSFGTSAVVSLQLQAGVNASLGTYNSFVVGPISASSSHEPGRGSSWATLMDEIRETLLLGVSDAPAVFGTLGSVRSARKIADEVFASPDSKAVDRMFTPIATSSQNASYDGADAPCSGSDLWLNGFGADESEES